MSIRPGVRFEIFKRDAFKCQYCGRGVPTVTLEADHIVPRSAGGSDEIDNLITACQECNRGKAASHLHDHPAAIDFSVEAERLRERERQVAAFKDAKTTERTRIDRDYNEVYNYWFKLWGEDRLHDWEVPWEGTLRKSVDVLGVDAVKDAMKATRNRFRNISSKPPKYLGAILRDETALAEGRLVPCAECGKGVVLKPGDDLSVGWVHAGCRAVEA